MTTYTTKYAIFYPGEKEPREIHEFMSQAAMSIVCGNSSDFNKAEIRPVQVDAEGRIVTPCE